MKALLLSGGMDSAAVAFLVPPDLAIAIDYGQVCAASELESAERVAERAKVRLEIVRANTRALGAGTLAGNAAIGDHMCAEWWPYRNQLLVTLAAMQCYKEGVSELLVGAVASDREAHADGSPEFFATLSHLTSIQEGGLLVSTPAIEMDTTTLVRRSGIPIDLLVATHSCHLGDLSCGQCRGCLKREKVLYELGLVKG